MADSHTAQQRLHADMDLPKSHTMLAASMIALGEGSYGPTWRHRLKCKGPTIISQLLLALYLLAQCTIFAYGFYYYLGENVVAPDSTFSYSFPIASAAGLALHLNLVVIVFTACRTLISLLRLTRLDGIMGYSSRFSFHELAGWTTILWAWIHTIIHWYNFCHLAAKNRQGLKGFLSLSFATGPGLSGHLMLTTLMLITLTSRGGTVLRRFWFFHYSFYVLFILWSIHGIFFTMKANKAPACAILGPFWKYWVCPGALYVSELILREWRGKRKSSILRVLKHPGNVLEIQMKKEHTVVKAGQYVYLCCPEVALCQDHRYVLTSAPEESYLAIHIRCNNEHTRSLAKALGCGFKHPKDHRMTCEDTIIGIDSLYFNVGPAIRRPLPPVSVDGPFGGVSENIFQFEAACISAHGYEVEAYASVLKSVWYRMNCATQPCSLRKVYFFWGCEGFGSMEWFVSLLKAIEAQDMDEKIEIYTYLHMTHLEDAACTAIKLRENGDIVDGFRVRTKVGRPKLKAILHTVAQNHAPGTACYVHSTHDPLRLCSHII